MEISKLSFRKCGLNRGYFPLFVIMRIWYNIKIKFMF